MEFYLHWGIQATLSSPQGAGAIGEKNIAPRLFQEAGFWVAENESVKKCGDITIARRDTGEQFRIEVKTMRESGGMYQACLYREGKTDCKYADYVLLIAITKSGAICPFIMPTTVTGNQKNLAIRGNPFTTSGKWATWRFDISNLFTFWELACQFQMFGGSPYTISQGLKFSDNIVGSISIVVEGE